MDLNGSKRRRLLLSSALVALCALPSLANAADVEANQDGRIADIVVTAQKRTERLQSVPVAVQVITSQLLTEQNQNNLEDLTRTVPGVHVSAGGQSNQIYIRGIGSGQNSTFDQAVATFSDDIYHGRSRMTGATFLDLDRIEILKGPQSTFFGNNAIAGALNIVSKKPGDHIEANVRALYGMHGQYAVEGGMGGPLVGDLSARLALTANGTDGWIENITTGQHVPKIRNLAGRLTLAYKPNEDLDVTLKVEGSKNRLTGSNTGLPRQWTSCPRPPFPASFGAFGSCPLAIALGVPMGLDNNKQALLGGTGNKITTQEDVLTLNYRTSGVTLTSVSGYSWYKYEQNYAAGELPVPFLQAQVTERYSQFSQEFRVSSDTGQPLEYLAGFYFQADRLPYDQVDTIDFLTPIVNAVPFFAPLIPYLPYGYRQGLVQKEKIYSGFGSLTWNATDKLKISGGLRASWVKKDYTAHFFLGTSQLYGGFVRSPPEIEQLQLILAGGSFTTLGSSRNLRQSDNALMPTARIQYELDHNVMLYARYDRGFLAGGFNGSEIFDLGNVDQFGPEHVDAYEIGLKSKLFDNKVLLNLSLFRSDYSDLQVTSIKFFNTSAGQGFGPIISNAGAARSQGIELEAEWAPTRDLRLGAHITLLDSKFTSFRDSGQTTLQQYCGSLNAQDFAGAPACATYAFPVPLTNDLTGKRTPYAAKWSGNISASYTFHLPGNYTLTPQINPYYTSSYYTVAGDPVFKVGHYVRLDARITLESPDRRWAFDVIGKNLTDRIIVAAPDLYYSSKEEPLNIAAQIRYRF